jgi:hypothetical protein
MMADKSTLKSWWESTSKAELDAIMPKVIEYGSSDLKLMGDALLMSMPQCKGKVQPEELAIAFYAFGKAARLMGAYADGVAPSEDTWHDLGVYSRMALRVRSVGEWPGAVK